MQAAEEWHKAAVAAEMAVEEQVAVEQAVSVVGGSRHRRRHRLRRRANGAPRSCVLESGRWINLPRARREAAGAIAVVQVRKQQRKQQRRCRFHDGSSGCRRSQCKYAPEGHAPAEDGADVLDPLVAAKLESLVGLMQAGLGRQQQEQLHQLQLQFQSVQPQADSSGSRDAGSCGSRDAGNDGSRDAGSGGSRDAGNGGSRDAGSGGSRRCRQLWQQRCRQRWQGWRCRQQ